MEVVKSMTYTILTIHSQVNSGLNKLHHQKQIHANLKWMKN